MPVEQVLQQPEVVERVKVLKENNEAFIKILRDNSRQEGNVVITDLRPTKRYRQEIDS